MELKVGSPIRIEDAFYVPEDLYQQYKVMNISSIFSWQAECLSLPGVLEGWRNLVYSAPTSAGKTLVAEIIVLKRILESALKAFIILPYVSVSKEKMIYLQKLFNSLGIRVGGYMAGHSPPGGLSAINVAVCTIEKANSLVNRLIEEERLDELGIVVVDELHLIGDAHRGYLLELLLTKLLFYSRRKSNSKSINESGISESSRGLSNESPNKCDCKTNSSIQIIGMSATLPNLKSLGQWLDAEVYTTNFRPVPLTEFILSCDLRSKTNQFYKVVDCNTLDNNSTQPKSSGYLELTDSLPLDSQLTSNTELNMIDEDGVFALCFDTLLNGHGVLVFCPTKQWCEQLADTMARQIFTLTQSYFLALHQKELNPLETNLIDKKSCDHSIKLSVGSRLAAQLDRVGLTTCVDQLKRCPAGLDAVLARCLGYGVAFHHAGLTVEEREIIEFGFRKGVIRILIATSTLSSGVNLPARRVIIRTPLFHGRILDFLTYKQMSGRAGRQGVDTCGQSILLCKPKDLGRVRQLIMNGMPPVNSCLMSQGGDPESSLKRALLEVIVNGFVETLADALLYLSSTLLAITENFHESDISKPTSVGESRRRSLRLSQLKICCSGNEMNNIDDNNNSNRFAYQMEHLLLLCIKDLQKQEFISIDQSACPNVNKNVVNTSFINTRSSGCLLNYYFARLQPTALGRAVLSSSLGPVHGLVVYEELNRARRSIALDTELHLVYLLTPVYLDVGADLDWLCYLEQYQSLSPAERRVADLIGIEERFITRCASGAPPSGSSRHGNTNLINQRLSLHRRFYTALVLYRLVNEDGLQTVAKKFAVNRGLLQSLQQQAATYAGMVTVFCNRLGWSHMERIIANFQSRLCYGVSDELVDLMRLLPLVNAERARALYLAGYSSISSLATARPQEISRILQRAVPFERKVNNNVCVKSWSCTILLDDGRVINEHEAGPLIVQQAKQLLEIDLASVYGKDLVIVSTNNDDGEKSIEVVEPVVTTTVDSSSRNNLITMTYGKEDGNKTSSIGSSQPIIFNTSFISSDDLNEKNGNCKYVRSFEDKEHQSAEQEVGVKRLKLSNDDNRMLYATNTLPSEISFHGNFDLDNSNDSDCQNNDNVDHKLHSHDNVQHNLNDTRKNDYEDNIITSSGNVSKWDNLTTSHVKTPIFENFTQSINQSFTLTSQLAAIIDNQILLTEKQSPSLSSSTSTSYKNLDLLQLPTLSESSNVPLSTAIISPSLSFDRTCELNDSLTFSMFESSFSAFNDSNTITTNNISSNNNSNCKPVITTETFKQQKQYDELTIQGDAQISFSLLMSQINFDTEHESKHRLSTSNQLSQSNLPITSINTNESFSDVERKSIGDLFNTSFMPNSPTNQIQIELKSPNSQHMNPIENVDCETDPNLLWTNSLVVETLVNKVDGGYDEDNLFSVVDVTQSHTLWKIFLNELNDRLEEISSNNQSHLNYVAVQPGWLLNMNPNNKEVESNDSIECLCWKSGPAGYRAIGGGINSHSNSSLYCSGFSISSIHLKMNVIFWINFFSQSDADRVPTHKCLSDVHDLFLRINQLNIGLVVWDVKWWYRITYDLLKIPSRIKFQIYCPNLTNWLTNPDQGQGSLLNEAKKISPHIVDRILNKATTSFAEYLEPPTQFSDWSKLPCLELSDKSSLSPSDYLIKQQLSNLPNHAYTASAQCFLLSLWTMNSNSCLSTAQYSVLNTIELPCHSLLARMESNGFNLNIDELNRCHHSLLKACKKLENVAHRLAGQPFSIDSPKEISKVLFKGLHLPQVTDASDLILNRKRNQAYLLNGHNRSSNLPKATNAVLSKLINLHPLPAIIMEWRHINGVLEKIFNSLVSTCRTSASIGNQSLRISPTYDIYTATGRIVSIMPNLQSVPKDICIDWSKLHCRSSTNNCTEQWTSPFDQILSELPKSLEIIRPRCAFYAPTGGLLISGDFCQLELRLLAHFSKDLKLRELLSFEYSNETDQSFEPNSQPDAFKKLAAHWLNIPHPNQVTDVHRQQAKQLCYAIIYGMGCHTLASQLNISEKSAQKLIDGFLNIYTGIQRFITTTVSTAHREGQIKTLNGHIRLLPALNSKPVLSYVTANEFNCNWSKKQELRNHFAVIKAERQAVNSIIQGSAAEIAKLAMLAVDEAISSANIPGYARLVLHEHDELIYEIFPESSVKQFGALIRQAMSSTGKYCNISVPLPVKLKIGPNWSDLKQVDW
ncbi:hypothetical protein MN116_001644 [Schistosoma mekongi]|uniref:DNA-directed DNA polymerase n=1 Tax=Schistosoma mekongi TaxID=38744 RepID=A0AAE1ZIH3_SCHME|nr:hypothetical protein MN116_001644 [Schistosoma mekongi]